MKVEEEARRASFVDSLVNSSAASESALDTATVSEQPPLDERELVDSQKPTPKSATKDHSECHAC